jgi:hypothetical protein
VSNSRSSSGVNRSEEKIAGDETTTDSSRAAGRFLRWVFIAFLPTLSYFSGQRSNGLVAASNKCPRSAANRTKRQGERGKKANYSPCNPLPFAIRGSISESGVKEGYKTTKIPRRPFSILRRTGRPNKSTPNSFIELTNCKVLHSPYQELLSKILVFLMGSIPKSPSQNPATFVHPSEITASPSPRLAAARRLQDWKLFPDEL